MGGGGSEIRRDVIKSQFMIYEKVEERDGKERRNIGERMKQRE